MEADEPLEHDNNDGDGGDFNDEDLWEAQEISYEKLYLLGDGNGNDGDNDNNSNGADASATFYSLIKKKRRVRLATSSSSAAAAASAASRVGGGLIRYLVVGVDFSAAMGERDADYRHPSKVGQVLTSLERFLIAFGDANPLAHFGFLVARNGLAKRVHELSPDKHMQCLKLRQSLLGSGSIDDHENAGCYGDFSLQNVLACALSSLSGFPAWGRRECVIVAAALSTCDPGDVFSVVEKCRKERVRVSIIGLGAEVFAFQRVCQRTGGTYAVARNGEHLQELLAAHVPPPPADAGSAEATPRLLNMGFPRLTRPLPGSAAFLVGKAGVLHAGEYHTCPRCRARTTGGALPQTCQVCDLFMASAAHLSRTYHHLDPLTPYVEEASEGAPEPRVSSSRCFGCCAPLQAKRALVCPKCRHRFCFDCDDLAREALHVCPGCL